MGNRRMNGQGGGGMKTGALLVFCLMLLLMSWDNQKTDAAAVQTEIPKDSIRLRILADSDNPADQLVKRKVRDAVVEQIDGWVSTLGNPQSLEQAREIIREHLPEVEQQVATTLKENGESYGYKVELGIVPFPAKLYGGEVYPAGNYEALRITLGSGRGQNWWCVLFPPLCFIDGGSGDALAKSNNAETATAAAAGNNDKKTSGKAASGKAGSAKAASADAQASSQKDAPAQGTAPAPEIHFFLWDMLKEFWGWLGHIFKSLIG